MTQINTMIGFLQSISLLQIAYAQPTVTTIINAVGGGQTFGTSTFQGVANIVITAIWSVITPVAGFLIIRSGLALITSQQEDKLERAKRTIVSTLVAIILIFVSQQFAGAFFNFNSLPSNGPQILTTEVNGIINWFLVLMAGVGALMVIVSALKIVANFGKEEGLPELRRTVFSVAAGLLLVALNPAISATLDLIHANSQNPQPNATAIISGPHSILTIVSNLLLYLALVATAIIIYAGVMMIINVGSEDQFTKSRSLILRAVIGLVVIIVSYAFAQFVIGLV